VDEIFVIAHDNKESEIQKFSTPCKNQFRTCFTFLLLACVFINFEIRGCVLLVIQVEGTQLRKTPTDIVDCALVIDMLGQIHISLSIIIPENSIELSA
jgi:hypothetical protein